MSPKPAPAARISPRPAMVTSCVSSSDAHATVSDEIMFLLLFRQLLPRGLFPRLLFVLCDLAGQSLQLPAVEHRVVHHTEHQLLGRSSAESVNNAFYRAHRHILPGVRRPVHKSPPFDLVGQVALLLEPAQHRSEERRVGK